MSDSGMVGATSSQLTGMVQEKTLAAASSKPSVYPAVTQILYLGGVRLQAYDVGPNVTALV